MAEPVKTTGAVDRLLQSDWLGIKFTLGAAFTVIEKEVGMPEQVFETGVTVIMPVIGRLEALVVVKALMVPELDTANPIPGFELIH